MTETLPHSGSAVLADLEDSELLAAHCAGDPDAFGKLVHRHRDRFWAVALRTTGDPEEAADALQEALLSAYRRAHTFRGESAVTTWIHRIVVNASIDRHRRRATRRWSPLPENFEGSSEEELFMDRAPRTDPADAAASAEVAQHVRDALAELPMDQRVVITLVDLEGWSLDEVSRVLDCPIGTIKSRGFRGRARLAEKLVRFAPQSS